MRFLSRPASPAEVPAEEASQQSHWQRLRRWARRRGATVMEYAVMLSFIIVVCFMAIQHFGSITGTVFKKDASQLPSGSTGS
jgi:Flp pilus assembly pilin Flp